MVSESSGRNESERRGGLEIMTPEAELSIMGRRQHGPSQSDRCGGTLWRGSSDSTMTRICRATGEALLVPSEIDGTETRITGDTGKLGNGERVTDGSAVAEKQSNVCGAKGPCCL